MSRAPDRPAGKTSVTRRRFLQSLAAAAAAAPALAALGQVDADAATARKTKKPAAPPPAAEARAGARPDFSVAKTAAERAALERQWKQMVDTVDAIKKVAVPAGSEMATGALAPRRLRRGEA